MRYLVIAECVDVRDGKRYNPGAHFPDPDADQVERLVAAKCIVEDKKAAPKAASAGKAAGGAGKAPPAPTDDLDAKDLEALREIATAEEVSFEDATTDVDLRTAIRAKRDAK